MAIDMIHMSGMDSVRTMTEIDWINVIDDNPPPDRVAEAGQELVRVDAMSAWSSWNRRQVIEPRRRRGPSQAETPGQLGISGNVAENHIVRGLRRLSKAIEEQDAPGMQKGTPGWKPTTGQIAGMSKLPNGWRGRRTGK